MTNTNPTPNTRTTGEPRLASIASWAVLVASFGLSASTWIALAVLAGFTSEVTIHGITPRLAWLMPISVDGYVIVALVLWMSPVPTAVTTFAKKNTYMAAGIGIVAQSAYHALLTWSVTGIIWRTVLAALVGSLPPAVAGLAVHMRALIRRHGSTIAAPGTATTPVAATIPPPSTDPQPTPAPVPDLSPAPIVTPAPVPPMPTPAQVVSRITAPPADTRPRPVTVPGPAARPIATRPSTPSTSPALSLPPATDSVSAPAVPDQSLAIVSPALLARATDVARQYRTEHGTPITSGQLAVRMKPLPSDVAAQLLAHMNLGPDNPTTPVHPSVNGHRTAAAR